MKYLEKSSKESIEKEKTLPTMPYNVFEELEKRYEYEKEKDENDDVRGPLSHTRRTNYEKIKKFFKLYIKKIEKESAGFKLLYNKKLNSKEVRSSIDEIKTLIQENKNAHPSSIYISCISSWK